MTITGCSMSNSRLTLLSDDRRHRGRSIVASEQKIKWPSTEDSILKIFPALERGHLHTNRLNNNYGRFSTSKIIWNWNSSLFGSIFSFRVINFVLQSRLYCIVIWKKLNNNVNVEYIYLQSVAAPRSSKITQYIHEIESIFN